MADYIGKKLTDKDPHKLSPEDLIGADISDWKGKVKSFNGQEFFYEPVFDRLSDLSKSIKAVSLTLKIFCVFRFLLLFPGSVKDPPVKSGFLIQECLI